MPKDKPYTNPEHLPPNVRESIDRINQMRLEKAKMLKSLPHDPGGTHRRLSPERGPNELPPTRQEGDLMGEPRRPGPLLPGEPKPSSPAPEPTVPKSSFSERERKLGIFRQQFYT